MAIEETIIARLRELPEAQRQTVLHFVEFLIARNLNDAAPRSLMGAWANMGIDITEEDIAEARRDMWGGSMSGSTKEGADKRQPVHQDIHE